MARSRRGRRSHGLACRVALDWRCDYLTNGLTVTACRHFTATMHLLGVLFAFILILNREPDAASPAAGLNPGLETE